ncbi:MAG: 4-hydroxy-tetrahydrodipicolinate synthase [Deltaproteobacteria bacterium]|nr:4-hydroxy-tetrahydrodipicolinate synthase [Deltaproteobacteria bacterium]MCX7952491.1 4-hydroxy-tetrahydrodipicolinate synthase [Deltaproteobacteria bacterium]
MAFKWNFRGLGTAIVTPFDEDLSLDLGSFERLLLRQLEHGVTCIIPCGTTGENPTLSEEEWEKLVSVSVRIVSGKGLVVAGAGSNDTQRTINRCKKAFDLGVDAVLVVTPYYNKPTQEGLFHHFKQVANFVKGPLILYNVPGRTGVNILPDTVLKIARECENVVGIKESSGNIGQIMELISKKPKDFFVYSGDDYLTFPMMTLGGDGVISVVSNEMPTEMKQLVDLCLNEDFAKARILHYRLLPLMEGNFLETSPGPVKYVLSKLGLLKEVLRPPLVPISKSTREKLDQIVSELELV